MDQEQPVSRQVFEAGLAATRVDLEAKIDATRVDLEAKIDATRVELEAKIDATSVELEAKIDAKVDAAKGDILDRMEKMETALLTAFHGYSQSVSAHFKVLDVQGSTLMERMAALEDRMINLETWRRTQ